MPLEQALQAAREQLAYWQGECDTARQAHDDTRVERCQRFIAQCELMISALERVTRQ